MDCYIDEEDTFILFLLGPQNFRLTARGIVAFKSIGESSELRDPYMEKGLAENRPGYLTNYVYEVKNGEFGDLIQSANRLNLTLHHYKIMTMTYLIDVVSEGEVVVEKLT